MATVIVFHSVYGLRDVELGAAERFRAAGHDVVVPDLYAGQRASSIEEGFGLVEKIGWSRIGGRAEQAAAELPAETVLAGFSMGASVVADLWPMRPHARAVLLFHTLADIPDNARDDVSIQVHVADPDRFAPPDQLAAWHARATRMRIAAQVFTYPGVGHFYTDATLSDYDSSAASLTWQRVDAFLNTL